MKKTKTQELVFGAMMLALYALVMILDRYSGGMLYMLFYYFLPLPFIVYGLKYGVKMYGAILFGAFVLGFMFGLPETAFFSITAILVAYCIVMSLEKNWQGTRTFLLVASFTVLSQILSVTVFASLFGYNLIEEITGIASMVQELTGRGIDLRQVKVIFAFSVVLMGCLEAFLFITLSDLVLLRLKMQRVPKFSIYQLKIPKIVGVLFIAFTFLQTQMTHDLVLFGFLVLWMLVIAQGLSYCYFLNAVLLHKPWVNAVAFVVCFIPGLNYFMTGMGLIEIFSENRKKIMYNKNQRGDNL